MTDTYKPLAQAQVPSSVGIIYTAPNIVGIATVVKAIKIANPTASAVTVKLHHVPNGGSATDANVILPTMSVDANGVAEFDGALILGQNETIRAVASAATSLTISLYGVESTGNAAALVAANGLTPAEQNVSNVLASTMPFQRAVTTATLVDAQIRAMALFVPETVLATGIGWYQTTNGVSLVADANNKVALYSADATNLTVLAESANDGTMFSSGTGERRVAFSSPISLAPGVYWAATLSNWSSIGTTPVVAATTALAAANVGTIGLPTNQKLNWTLAGQTDFPAVSGTHAWTAVTASTSQPLHFIY